MASSLMEGWKHVDMNEGHMRRRYVGWDQLRAKFCIMQDYLGPEPTFGLDDLEVFLQISCANHDEIRSYLCSVQPSSEMDLMPLKERILAVIQKF